MYTNHLIHQDKSLSICQGSFFYYNSNILLQFKILLIALIFKVVHSNYEEFDKGTAPESKCYCYNQPETNFEYSICGINSCPLNDSIYLLVKGQCFYFERESKNFEDANANCKEKGG